jgi:hypothetical protein
MESSIQIPNFKLFLRNGIFERKIEISSGDNLDVDFSILVHASFVKSFKTILSFALKDNVFLL